MSDIFYHFEFDFQKSIIVSETAVGSAASHPVCMILHLTILVEHQL